MFGHSRCIGMRSDELLRLTGWRTGSLAGSRRATRAGATETPKVGLPIGSRDRGGGALCFAHVPRPRPAAKASSLTSLRKAPHRPDPEATVGLDDGTQPGLGDCAPSAPLAAGVGSPAERNQGRAVRAVPRPRPAAKASLTSLRKAPHRPDPEASVGFDDRRKPRLTTSVFNDRAPPTLVAEDAGWLAERSKGGAPGSARRGGHERSRPPGGLGHRPTEGMKATAKPRQPARHACHLFLHTRHKLPEPRT